MADGVSRQVRFRNTDQALMLPDTAMRIFGKGELNGHRRLGVLLARGKDTDEALKKVFAMREKLEIEL